MEARYYITMDGATVVLITAPTFEAAAGAYLAFTGGRVLA